MYISIHNSKVMTVHFMTQGHLQLENESVMYKEDYATEDNSTHNILSTLPSGLSRLKGHGEETFLLVSAALANLTFMSPVTSSAMRHNATVRTLVNAVRAAPTTTLFAKDQVSSTELQVLWFVRDNVEIPLL